MSEKYHIVITNNETGETARDENSDLFLYVGDNGKTISVTFSAHKVSSLELANLIARVEIIVQNIKEDHPSIVPLIQSFKAMHEVERLKAETEEA